jgi:hypothetical protein
MTTKVGYATAWSWCIFEGDISHLRWQGVRWRGMRHLRWWDVRCGPLRHGHGHGQSCPGSVPLVLSEDGVFQFACLL